MKQFIYKILFFITIPALLYSSIGMFLKTQLRNEIGNFKTIILGDSQTEFIRFEEIYNHSIDGSPYYVHYGFAKEFIDQFKGKRVYIACNYHNLSKLYQNRLANDNLWPGWRASTFRKLDKYSLLNSKSPQIRPKNSEYSLFDIKKIPRLFKEIYFSKVNENNRTTVINDTLSIQSAIERHWQNPKYILDDSIQITYLEKLIRLLNNNECEVILLKMPLTNYYSANVPYVIKRKLSELESDYKVHLLDLNLELNISNCYDNFKDYGHLNKTGDSLVTTFFIKNELNKARTHNNAYKK
jgi:hypothetical protein